MVFQARKKDFNVKDITSILLEESASRLTLPNSAGALKVLLLQLFGVYSVDNRISQILTQCISSLPQKVQGKVFWL